MTLPVDKPTEPAGSGQQPDSGRTFTQEELDAKIEARLAEERRKQQRQITEEYGDLNALKTAKQRLDELEAAEMSEAEKLRKQIADLTTQQERAAQQIKAEQLNTLRLKVGHELNLPPILAERLTGEDEETLKADAQKVLASLRESGRPVLPDINATEGALSGSSKGFKLTLEQETLIQKSGVDREKYIERLKELSGE